MSRFNVFPNGIERADAARSALVKCAAVGKPGDGSGEAGKVVIVKKIRKSPSIPTSSMPAPVH
mgnify:FL=1